MQYLSPVPSFPFVLCQRMILYAQLNVFLFFFLLSEKLVDLLDRLFFFITVQRYQSNPIAISQQYCNGRVGLGWAQREGKARRNEATGKTAAYMRYDRLLCFNLSDQRGRRRMRFEASAESTGCCCSSPPSGSSIALCDLSQEIPFFFLLLPLGS